MWRTVYKVLSFQSSINLFLKETRGKRIMAKTGESFAPRTEILPLFEKVASKITSSLTVICRQCGESLPLECVMGW